MPGSGRFHFSFDYPFTSKHDMIWIHYFFQIMKDKNKIFQNANIFLQPEVSLYR